MLPSSRSLRRASCAVLLAAFAARSFGQTAPTPPAAPVKTGEEAIVLSPFVISTDADDGYAATESASASRFKQKLKDIPQTISIMSGQFLKDIGAVDLADVMQLLRDETQETVLIGVRADTQGIVLEQVAATQPVKFLVDPGTHFPLHTSAPGKVFVAFLPEAEREAVLRRMKFTRYNERTLDSRAKFEAELGSVKELGYGLDRAEQIEGLHCVGAPIFNHRGHPIAAIWVTGPSFRFPASDLPRIGVKVVAAAERISRRFGYNLL